MGPKTDTSSSVQNRVMPLTYSDMGVFHWDPTGNQLVLDGQAESVHNWLISHPDTLIRLNNLEEIIRPKDPTIITRTESFTLLEKPISMSGKFRYYADSPSFTEQITQQRWPVWMDSTYLEVERYYLQHSPEPGAEMPLQIKGHLVMRPSMEDDQKIPHVVIDRVVRWLN
jgi:hypothetical protein